MESTARYSHEDVQSVAKNPAPRIPCQESRDANKSRDANTCGKFDARPCPTDVSSAGAVRRTRSVTAVSGRTQKKDSLAAPKSMSFKDFLHFARCGCLRDLTAGLRCGSPSLRLPCIRPLAKTRMNTRFLPAHDGPKRAVTCLLTRVRFL